LEETKDLCGVELLNFIQKKSTTQGNAIICDLFSGLSLTLHRLLIKKMYKWMLFGISKDSKNEFFVSEQTAGNTFWDEFVINSKQIPYFLTREKAESVLFVGKSARVLKSTEGTQNDMCTITSRFSESFAVLCSAPKFDKLEILGLISDLEASVGNLLFKSVTSKDQISNHLLAFRAVYLAGQGIFLEELIEEEMLLKKRMSSALLPLDCGDLNHILKKTLKSVGQYQLWYPVASNFKFVESSTSLTNTNSKTLFGSHLSLKYEISWPLNLIINDLQS
jgi:Gamma tubulin complex component N-terminal